jgi:ADP-ribosyl-[dinitrogen reductase] hydrolase
LRARADAASVDPVDAGTKDRKRGALLGLAIGDALGAPVEFEVPGRFEPVTGFQCGGPHDLEAGEWTDDTSMALALADSLIETGWDLDDQAERYVAWWRTGQYSVNGRVFDIGRTTVQALERFAASGDAQTSGDDAELASGNGSIMRLAPVPIALLHMFPARVEALAERLADSSRPTHASPQCLSACVHLGVLLCGLMHGLPREEVLAPDWEPLQRARKTLPLHPAIAEVAAGSFARRRPPQIRGSGYVVQTLEAALWAFHDARDFREAVLRAVNLGDDADTTGAVCGQLAGACFGESGIPREWLRGLRGRDQIDPILERLVR